MGQQNSALTLTEINDVLDDASEFSVQFTINNVMYKVTKDIPSNMSLNTYIREEAKLKGTKVSCHEGGCGVCIVAAEINGYIMSVNSCLVPVLLCDGWKITTIEGLGNRIKGYHTLQAALAEMNGSQCGYCSAGWIMSMYSLSSEGKMTMKEIENSFASNLCRCTGYRPILDTFKSFASDSPPVMRDQIKDIEEMYNIKSCKNCPKQFCNGGCKDLEIIYKSNIPRSLKVVMDDQTLFFKITDINNLFTLMEWIPNLPFTLNGGNTSHGVYRRHETPIRCDINSVAELHKIEKTDNYLCLGANVSLTMAKKTFEKHSSDPGFEYLARLAKHIDLVASIPIRNVGTIAGNLMIKHEHREFPSDIFLILETAGAELHILDAPGSKFSKTLLEFLDLDMKGKIIYSIVLPSMPKEYIFKSYKIMPRAQNAHAIVNAGFLFKLDGSGKLLDKPNIIFGGIRPDFLHASKTEAFLDGKMINDSKTVQTALGILNSELNPDYVLPDYKPEYRKLVATALLYKFILNLNSNKINSKFKSGGFLIQREVSSGKQIYETDESMYPLNQPVSKIEAIYQTSGEAEYVNDIIVRENEVFCAFCIAEAPGMFETIDSKEAMEMPGVVAFFTAKDIPGSNTFIHGDNKHFFMDTNEPLLADKEIIYAGQPYGLIVATSLDKARLAAMKVKLIYVDGPRQKPMITIQDVIASNDKTRMITILHLPMQGTPGTNNKHKIKGTMSCGSQYHFPMEKQTCVCVPLENGIDVFSATQWMDLTQSNIAKCLNVPQSSINVQVRRLGGAYGAKISRATQTACACALACHLLRRPTRFVMTIEDNMRAVGKRPATFIDYDLSVDEMGKIQKLEATYWGNAGYTYNDTSALAGTFFLYNCYDPSVWTVTGNDARTDIPSNTWCRSPGSAESIHMTECIMERIARVTGLDPIQVRLNNMNDDTKKILEPMIAEMKKTSEYDKRMKDVQKFNSENRWKKRGMSMVLMRFALEVWGQFHALVSIFARDGTVSICHGGIEMGQGLNTKLAQVASHVLGVDLSKINVKPSVSWSSPNSYVTGGAHGSDTCGYATLLACQELVKRLEPIKEMLGGNPSWEELVLTAHHKDVNLCSSAMFKMGEQIKSYPIWGVVVSEVEVDVLTGLHIIRRVDLMEDTGVSLSPKIDVGQVEGAFIMGAGYWTTEDLLYDPDTGALTNYRTWNYKVPGAKDIPVDFRVTLHQKLPNPLGILRSKSTGESPFCLSCGIPIAIRNALNSARSDAGNKDVWYQLDNVLSPENILLNSLTTVNDMIL